MQKQKRVAAIHDISCFGKCSLTVALPMLSAAGLETCCIPTAVLSTHTGGFSGYTYRDLTEDILPIARHWNSLNLHFDAVYSGFLGSDRQIDIICRVLDEIASTDTFVMVDPVMGDNGSLYSVFSNDFPVAMRRLCARADLIVPNMTEAFLLLDEPYHHGPYTEQEIHHLLDRLAELCPGQIVLTGVHFDKKMLGAATLDRKIGTREFVLRERVEGFYHGTGDVYASTLLAALLRGFSLSKAASIAADYTVLSILATKEIDKDLRYGVNFERNLPVLMRILEGKEENA